jgi:hypothetical protein
MRPDFKGQSLSLGSASYRSPIQKRFGGMGAQEGSSAGFALFFETTYLSTPLVLCRA